MKKYLLLSVLLLILNACTGSCNQKKSTPSINLTLAYPLETIDPRYATSAVASRVNQLIFAPLFVMGEDGIPQPFLVKNFEQLSDTSFKIIIKDDLYFHDGSNLTAHDVAYTFLDLSSKDVLSPHQEKFLYLKDIKIIDDKTLIFELNKTHAAFITELCALGIVSKKSCFNRSKECRNEYNGSGPFMVEKWDMNKETLYLKPFLKWFEGSAKNNLTVRVVRDENTRILELIGQKTDIVEGDISPGRITELKKQDFLDVKQIPSFGFTYLAFNLRGPKPGKLNSEENLTRAALANKQVRQAIAHALNIDQVIEKILLNTASRSTGMIPNIHWAKDKTLQPIKFDPVKAELLLDEAGFKRKANNFRFNLTITTSQDRMRQSIAMLYADFLQKVGINAQVKVKDWSAVFQDMKQGNFEMFSAIWVPVTDPDLYFWVHHSSNIPAQGKEGGNRHAYINKEVDELTEQGRITFDKDKRKAIYQNIEKIVFDELPYILLWHEDRIVVINKKVLGYEPLNTGSLINLRKAYLKE